MDKHKVVYLYDDILLTIERNKPNSVCKINQSQNLKPRWKKPYLKDYMPYDSIFRNF